MYLNFQQMFVGFGNDCMSGDTEYEKAVQSVSRSGFFGLTEVGDRLNSRILNSALVVKAAKAAVATSRAMIAVSKRQIDVRNTRLGSNER